MGSHSGERTVNCSLWLQPGAPRGSLLTPVFPASRLEDPVVNHVDHLISTVAMY